MDHNATLQVLGYRLTVDIGKIISLLYFFVFFFNFFVFLFIYLFIYLFLLLFFFGTYPRTNLD